MFEKLAVVFKLFQGIKEMFGFFSKVKAEVSEVKADLVAGFDALHKRLIALESYVEHLMNKDAAVATPAVEATTEVTDAKQE